MRRPLCKKCEAAGFDPTYETCVYCGSGLSSRHEHDHFPIPKRHGGEEVYPVCLNCHDLKDRIRLDDWGFVDAWQAISDAPPVVKIFYAIHPAGASGRARPRHPPVFPPSEPSSRANLPDRVGRFSPFSVRNRSLAGRWPRCRQDRIGRWPHNKGGHRSRNGAQVKGRLEFRGTQAIFFPVEGGVWFLTRSQLEEFRRTGELKPFSDPGLGGVEAEGPVVGEGGRMTAGVRVRTPDGRSGEVISCQGRSVWVRCFQASNVNRRELWRADALVVIA